MKVFAPDSLVGDRFRVEREVGRGGVGIVYRAHDQATDKPVALKVIGLSGVDAKEETRFVREGRVVAGIAHPNVVQVVAFGELDGTTFVAMEWLEGEDLLVRHKRMALSLEEILDVGIQMADALSAAHAVGIVHRDVKPSNVLALKARGEDGRLRIKLVDFGVALSGGDSRTTMSGGIVGTPAYMAPEQARGDELIDARADLYALGATLFELTAGRPPHVGPTPVAILARLVTTPAPRLGEHAPDPPASFDELLSQLLATHPDERPACASIVRDTLKAIALEIVDEQYSRARPRSSAGASEFPHSADSLSLSPSQTWGSRLVTTMVATSVPKGERMRLLSHLRAHGAEAVELGNDALVAHLGVDRALGDEAARAADLATRLAQNGAAVGIATGRTKLTKSRTSGEVVDRAASLSRDAQKGRVLLDTTTSELARGRFELRARSDGSSELGNPVHGKRDAGGGAPFVGREAELAQISDAFERCADDCVPVVATISGAPGLGKTRLGREALSRFASHASHPNIALVECESFAKGQTLGIMADVARGLCGLTKSATVIDALAAVQSLLKDDLDGGTHELVAKLVANQALIESRLSQGTRDVLWLSLTHIALNMAKLAPLVLAIEDAQWADAESLAWVDHVLARSVGSSVFVLLSARPGLWRENPTRFAGRDHVKVELRPLARKNVRAIAKAILGAKAETPEGEDLTQSIAEQSGGSPLFAQELARLTSLGGSEKRATPTIEAAIQVHLDALDAPAREAARRLSVYGTRCWDKALSALGIVDAAARMKELVSAEVLVEQASSRFRENREYIFKHALTRDVAYASLGDDELRELHVKAGQFLLTVGEDDATVARHLELGKSFIQAAEYMDRAGRRALATNSLQQAVEFAEKALAFAEDPTTTFARAQVLEEAWSRLDARAGERDSAVRAMRDAAYDEPTRIMAKGARLRYEDATGGTSTTTSELEAVIHQARAHRLFDEEVRCLAALAARLAFAGDTDQAEDRAKELLELAKVHRLSAAAVDAWQTIAIVMQARGNVGKALDARKNAVSAAREAGLKTREATLIINMGFALTTVGAKEEAKAAILDGISLAERVGSPGTVRHGQMNLLCWAATFGADADTDAFLVEPRALADSVATGSWVPHDRATLGVLFYRGLELLRRGDHERARNLLQSSALGYKATRMQDVMPVALGAWAEAERRCGLLEKALSLGQEASTLLDQGSPSLLNEASVFLSLHDTYVDLGRRDDAKAAISLGVPHLLTRLEGLAETSRSLDFLMKLAENKSFLSVADAYGLVPLTITALLGGRSTTLGPPPVHA